MRLRLKATITADVDHPWSYANSSREGDGDAWYKINTLEDFAEWAKLGGWDSVEDFEKSIGEKAPLKPWFLVVNDRLYLKTKTDKLYQMEEPT